MKQICVITSEVGFLTSLHLSGTLTHLLWQEMDSDSVFVTVGPQLDLRQHLVGEGVAHNEARVTHGTAQVDQSALR